jgi:hypothetical protein
VTAIQGDKSGQQSEDESGSRTDSSLRPIAPRSFATRSFAIRSFLAGAVLLGIAYAADYGVFRYRLATNRQPFGSVTVEHYDAVEHKDGKAELIFDPPVQQTCVHSLFPYAGDPPCWYLSRHAEQKTDI